MALTLKMTEDAGHIEKQKCLDYLRKNKVDAGLTSHASGRSRFLLGIHTRGSPIMHISPRTVVKPALAKESLKTEMGDHLLESCKAAMKGNLAGTQKGLEEAGQRGADGIREYIDGGISPPNVPVTLSGGWIYNQVTKKGVLVSGKSGDKPMKDTEALYNDFDYEITGR